MVVSAETEAKKQAANDALLHGVFLAREQQEDAQDNTVPFYKWSTTKEASEEDYGALEMLARNLNQPGTTQDAGVILAIDLKTGVIEGASPNTQRYLGLELEEVMGAPPASLFACTAEEFQAAMESSEQAIPATCSMKLAKLDKVAHVSFCRSENGTVIEIEEVQESSDFDLAEAAAIAASARAQVSQIERKEELFAWIVNTIQKIISFDRVKVYKFHADQHGEVLAETLKPGCVLESCNGLHYPATDIPQRARDLYLLNHIRTINDTHARPLKLAVSDDKLPTSIYLTSSCLRGVHPCHLEYLQNMKVTASVGIAVIIKGKLWGLIACHHGAGPRLVPRPVREECWTIVEAFNARLSEMLLQEREERTKALEETQERLLASFGEDARPNLLAQSLDLLVKLVESNGVALVESKGRIDKSEGRIYKSGKAPSDTVIRNICTRTAHETERFGVLAIDSISTQLELPGPGEEEMAGTAGVVVVKVSPGCHLLWFREEVVQEVRWGADDNKEGADSERKARAVQNLFGARHSFNQWVEEVKGTCRRWSQNDCDDAKHVAMAIDDRIMALSKSAEFVTDWSGRILRWNKAMVELSGLKTEMAEGKSLPQVCVYTDQQEIETWIASFRSGRRGERRIQLNLCARNYSERSSEGALAFVGIRSTNALAQPTFRFKTVLALDGKSPNHVFSPVNDIVGGHGSGIVAKHCYSLPDDFHILDAVSTPYWVMDANPEGRVFLWCNDETCKVLQFTKNEFHCLDLQPDLVDARVMQMWYERVQLNQQVLRGNHVLYSRSASVPMEVEVVPIKVETTDGVKIVCMISARGVGTESPYISEASMRSHEMLQVSKVMMMLFRENGQMIDSNLSAKVYYSMALAKEGISLRDVFESCEWANKDECEEAYGAMLKVCKSGQGKIFELERIKQHMQSGVVHLLQFFSARDPETGKFAISVNETDISRMKSVQNKLIAAQQQQERFLAATSHELRTPLHAIVALSGSLMRDAGLSPHALRILKLIQSSGHSLTTLVNDILDAAALRAGMLVLKNEVVNLSQVVSNVFEVCGMMTARGVETINDVPVDLGPIESDSGRLTQILMNLVGNSVKFTSTGWIKISASMDTQRSQVEITVADTGKGVPEDMLDRIWEAFGQAESGEGGTGLGLTIVQSLVTVMGGAIQLTSSTKDEDRGTVFTIVLPVSLPKASEDQEEEDPVSAAEELLKRSENPETRGGTGEEPTSPWGTFLSPTQESSTGIMDTHTWKAMSQMRQQAEEAEEKMRLQERELHTLKAMLQRQPGRSNAMMRKPTTSLLASSVTHDVFVLGNRELSSEEKRAFEVVECIVRRFTLDKAIQIVDRERSLPMVVLLDATSLGQLLEPACTWARSLSEVPVVLLASTNEQAEQALGLGCTGTLRMPLVASELARELRRQEDAKNLWLTSHVLRNCAAPATDAIAARTKDLLLSKKGSVCAHDRLGVVSFLFEVQLQDGTSGTLLNLYQLVLKRCEELVASSAKEHEALMAEAAGNRFTVVTGHQSASGQGSWQASLSAGYQVALQVMRKLLVEEGNLEDCGVRLSLRVGVSAGLGYEGLVGCAQDQLAFFGEPVTEAAKLAAMAQDGQIGISSECYARLYPGSEAGKEDVCFFSPHVDKAERREAQQPPSVSLHSKEQFLSFTHFANKLPRVPDAARSGPDHTPISHMDMKLVSRVMARPASAQVAPQTWESEAVRQGLSPAEDRWNGMLEVEHEESRTVRVLSVDDNPVNQVVVESALLPLGHEVLTCMDSGPTLYEMLEKMDTLPDIILLDVMLPSGSGVDVLRELRKTYSSTDLPIILVSGKSSKDSIIEGLEAGGNDYIVKPFDIAELVTRINTQLHVSTMVSVRLELARRTELLNKMLPREIVPRILAGETLIHHYMSHASFLVAEIVGFSELSQKAQTEDLIELLSALYNDFDRLCDKHEVFKVETDADTYIVASGHTDSEADEEHTTRLVQIGLDMIRHARRYTNAVSGDFLEVRLGISSGPTSAGVISAKLPHYCFFGNTINMAKKMQLHGFASTITMSTAAKELVGKSVGCVSLGIRVIPGNGPIETFVVKHKSTPWEKAVETVCHAHNFVGYADGSRVRGSAASQVRAVGSADEPGQFRSRRPRGGGARNDQEPEEARGGGAGLVRGFGVGERWERAADTAADERAG